MKVNITHSAEIDVRPYAPFAQDTLELKYGKSYMEQIKVISSKVINHGNQVRVVCDIKAYFETTIYDEFGGGELVHEVHARVLTSRLNFNDLNGLQRVYPEDLSLDLVEDGSQLDNREIENLTKELYSNFGKLRFNFVIDVKDEETTVSVS